jgi:phosphonoacetate hydrolase
MLTVNQRSYRPPTASTVVVCVDGCEPDYLGQAVATGHMPWLKRTLAEGTGIVADCVVPSFTASAATTCTTRRAAPRS